ncbi:MAG: rhamnulokinase [Ignavibacteriae bacterium]|nr:rhamnulokinase [Ignavibacteriota bacterium]
MLNIKKFIGLDLGAESGRCVVAKLDGNKLNLDEIYRFTTHNYTKNNQFHWDINKIFDEIFIGLKKSVEKYGSEFESIGIDTWGVDYALIDSENKLLNDPYHYRDDRTDNIAEEVFEVISKDELYNLTGIQTQQFNTIFQLFHEFNYNTSQISKAQKFLLMPDYIKFLLSGVINAEYTIASTTGLTDQNKRDWDWDIIDRLKFNRNLFPPIVEPGEKVGTLFPEISKLTGLKNTTPIIATGQHDTASAVVSAPSQKKNWAFLSSGTWSIMGVELDKPVTRKIAMDKNFSNEGGVQGTIRFLKNIIGLWPIQECRREWLIKGKKYNYPDLTKMAEEFGSTESWLNLNDPLFFKAGNMPDKIISFLKETNQNNNDEIGFLIRVVLESLAFNYRFALHEIELITGNKITELNAVGGGVQNELLCQLTADALNIPVLAGPIEGTIIGNIGVQSIATNLVKDLKSFRDIVRNSFEIKTYLPQNPQYFELNEHKYKSVCAINC